MGYSEIRCHICGVSFTIGRLRTPGERRSVAWNRFGPMLNAVSWHEPPDYRDSFVVENDYPHRSVCGPNDGCMVVLRKRVYPKPMTYFLEGEEDNSEDEDWTQEEEEENEPLEYCSDDEGLEDPSSEDVEMRDAGDNEKGEEEEGDEAEIGATRPFWMEQHDGPQKENANGYTEYPDLRSNEDLPEWYREFYRPIGLPDANDMIDEMQPLFEPGADKPVDPYANASEENKASRKRMKHIPYWSSVEHIASPSCKKREAYNGHEISEQEMRLCLTSQCLVQKPSGWSFHPEADDEDWEQTGQFFLSGLSDHMPSRDWGDPHVEPARHGCENLNAENSLWEDDEAYEYAMPFHPYCFEVSKRTSLLLTGKINVSLLTSWWMLEGTYDLFYRFPRDPTLRECGRSESWEHKPGTAWLVANPLYVPKLEDILQACVETDPNFDPRGNAFSSLKPPQQEKYDTLNDPFAILPGELQIEILDRLPSTAIAALRLSSRAMSQLPISYFQKLLHREMPYLWEAWPTNTESTQPNYAKWVTGRAWELNKLFEKYEKDKAALRDYISIVKEELPEASECLDEVAPAHYEALETMFLDRCNEHGVQTPSNLPSGRTNYFKLYTLITRHWTDLRGLRNRKRIWTDCEEILRRVDKYREEGRLDAEGKPVDSLPEIIRRNEEEDRKRREKQRQEQRERNRKEREEHEKAKAKAEPEPRRGPVDHLDLAMN